jgi:predicted polyphosphate/ATP-dependent NAD kinase
VRGSLGLIVNPIAGMGGKVGLKGTDGATLAAALERGAEPVAAGRALRALERLKPVRDGLRLVTWAGAMGGAVAERAGLTAEVIGGEAGTATSAADTREAAAAMRDCALVLFAGGDGTARDVHDALGGEVPVLGIPTGVKMHSAVFATSPGAAGELASAWLAGEPTIRLREAEVMDVDEAALREGRVSARLHGYARVPFARHLVQRAKAGSFVPDEAALDGLAGEVAAEMEPGRLYILGPGTTTRRVLERLGLRGTLLGVDAVRDRRLVGAALGEAGLLALLEGGGPATIIVGVTGGQGFLFGRGNQAISAEVIRRVGRDSITVLAGAEKLAALDPCCLRVDTGDPEVDRLLAGFVRVRTAPGRASVMRVAM